MHATKQIGYLTNKLVITMLAFLCLSCYAEVNVKNIINVSLSSSSGNQVSIKFENIGTRVIYIPRWDVAEGGELTKKLLKVKNNGEIVGYIGKLVKRPAAVVGDMIEINPGCSIINNVDISKFYDISSIAGRLEVRFDHVISIYTINSGELESIGFVSVESNKVTLNK